MPKGYTGDIGSDIASPIDASRAEVLGRLSRSLVQVLRERGGRGPTRAKSYWLGDDALIVLFGDCFTQAEKTLWEAGAFGAADAYRKSVQRVLAEEMRHIVQETVGRSVVSMMGSAHHEPDLLGTIFLLEPAGKAPSE